VVLIPLDSALSAFCGAFEGPALVPLILWT